MPNYRVNMVDVNDVMIPVFVKTQYPEDAIAQAEFENAYLRVVNVDRINEEGEWEMVFAPDTTYQDYDSDGEEYGDGMTDVEADADTLRNCGWGTDEDYGYADEVY